MNFHDIDEKKRNSYNDELGEELFLEEINVLNNTKNDWSLFMDPLY